MIRFMVMQQVGGDLFGVYDLIVGDMVRVYDGKKAKQKATELQAILQRGWRETETTQNADDLRKLRSDILTDSDR